MANNEEIVTFNSAQIAKNAELIASGCGVEKARRPFPSHPSPKLNPLSHSSRQLPSRTLH